MKISINAEEFLRGVEATKEEIDERLARAMALACTEVEAAAKSKIPKGSPHVGNDVPLIQSMAYSVKREAEGRCIGEVGSPLLYAPFVHEGTGIYSRTGMGRKDVPWSYQDARGGWHTTSGMQPNPFLEKAADEKRSRIPEIFVEKLKG